MKKITTFREYCDKYYPGKDSIPKEEAIAWIAGESHAIDMLHTAFARKKPLVDGDAICPYDHGIPEQENWVKKFWNKYNIAYVKPKGFATLGEEIIEDIQKTFN